jgi:hypothetical protein
MTGSIAHPDEEAIQRPRPRMLRERDRDVLAEGRFSIMMAP